jgi:transposase
MPKGQRSAIGAAPHNTISTPPPTSVRTLYQQVRMDLFNSGQSQAAISRALGMGRKTIRRWLRRGEFPERKPPYHPPPKVSEFADYLQQRWNEGCHSASRLYQEIRKKVIRESTPW